MFDIFSFMRKHIDTHNEAAVNVLMLPSHHWPCALQSVGPGDRGMHRYTGGAYRIRKLCCAQLRWLDLRVRIWWQDTEVWMITFLNCVTLSIANAHIVSAHLNWTWCVFPYAWKTPKVIACWKIESVYWKRAGARNEKTNYAKNSAHYKERQG